MEMESETIPGRARRFIRVAPPTVHAGIGNALRQAFDMNGETQSFAKFQDLLDRLG